MTPTGREMTAQGCILLLKGFRQHLTERDYNYNRFRVETQEPPH